MRNENYNKSLVYIAACIGMAFFGVCFIIIGTVLPMLNTKYALDAVGSSSLVAFLPIGILLGSLIFGPIVDRYGYKNLMIASTLTIVIGIEGMSYFEDLNLLRICIFITGFGGGILNGETNAIVAEIYEGEERASKLSLLGVCYGVGAIAMPLLLVIFAEHYTYSQILSVAGILLALSVIYFIMVKFPQPKFQQGMPIKEVGNLLKEPILLILSFILFFQSGMEGLINNWTTTYLGATTTIDPEKILLTLTSFIVGMTLMRATLSLVFKILNQNQLLIIGLIVSAISMLALSYAQSFGMALVAMFVLGAGLASVYPIIVNYIGGAYPRVTGTAVGIAVFMAQSGNLIMNYIMGYITKEFGDTSFPFFLLANIALQTILVLLCIKQLSKKKLN